MFSQGGSGLGLHSPHCSSALYHVSAAELRSRNKEAILLVLEVCHVWLASLVGDGVISAPLGCDPPEVTTRVFALSIVAHLECNVTDGSSRGSRYVQETRGYALRRAWR